MVIDESKQDRLHWIINDVLGLENLLNQSHVTFGTFFLFLRNESVYIRNIAIVLCKLNLALDRPEPLVQVVL